MFSIGDMSFHHQRWSWNFYPFHGLLMMLTITLIYGEKKGKKYKKPFFFFFWKTHFTILYNGASPLWNQKFPHTSVPKTWHTSQFDTNLTTLPLDWTLGKIVTVKFCGPKVKCFKMVWLGCDIWVNHDPHTTPFLSISQSMWMSCIQLGPIQRGECLKATWVSHYIQWCMIPIVQF